MLKNADGSVNTGPGQICHSNYYPDDPRPQLTISLECGLGLSKVVVTNRADDWPDRINAFSLDAVNPNGTVALTYKFQGSKSAYTISIDGARGSSNQGADCYGGGRERERERERERGYASQRPA